jgi:PAS domain S-box-containing protein
VETFETVRVQKNGGHLHLSITLSPVKDAAGHVIGVSTLARDISLQKQAEAALQRKTHELTDFFENAAVGLQWVGADGTVLWANQAELNVLGYTREEYIGRNITDFYDDPAVISDILQRLANRETLDDYEAQIRFKDGSLKDVQITSNALFEDGEFVHSRCFTRDITARNQAEAVRRQSEATLQESQSFLQSTLDALSSHIAVLDESGTIIAVNRSWEHFAEENNGSPAACARMGFDNLTGHLEPRGRFHPYGRTGGHPMQLPV